MEIVKDIKLIITEARTQAYQSINLAMVYAYWRIGKRIVDEDQNGKIKAEYGKKVIKKLSTQLKKEFGRGFSVDNLENMRKFYLAYPISETVSRKLDMPKFNLSCSHYKQSNPNLSCGVGGKVAWEN